MSKKIKKVISVGLDLSLVATGLVLLENGKIIKQTLIKSKKQGDQPIDELIRIKKIVNDIRSELISFRVHVAVIEGLAFMVKKSTALVQLSALNYMVREMLYEMKIPFYICAPTTLKRFATGKGNSQKDHMILNAYKKYDIDDIDNNIADAIFLAKIGSAICGYEKVTSLHQIETIELMKKQS